MTRAEKDRRWRELSKRILHAEGYGTMGDYYALYEECDEALANEELFKKDYDVLIRELNEASSWIEYRAKKEAGLI